MNTRTFFEIDKKRAWVWRYESNNMTRKFSHMLYIC